MGVPYLIKKTLSAFVLSGMIGVEKALQITSGLCLNHTLIFFMEVL